MNIGRKLMLTVIASIVLVLIPAAGAIYSYTKHNMLVSEAATLSAETKMLVASDARSLLEAESSLKSLSRILAKSLAELLRSGESEAFDRLVQIYPDQAWRSCQ